MIQFILFSCALVFFLALFAAWFWIQLNKDATPTNIEPMGFKTTQTGTAKNFNEWAKFIHTQTKKNESN
jgi:hypothetical protein